MQPKTFYKNFYPLLTRELQDFLHRYASTLTAKSTKTLQPYILNYTQTTQSFIENPGKYLRPYFSFVTYYAITSDLFKSKQTKNSRGKTKNSTTPNNANQKIKNTLNPKEIISTTPLIIGAFLELIHNHLLIHDDIMDKSPKRRNKPTVWKSLNDKLKNRHNAYSLAILSGNQVLLMAINLLSYSKTINKQGIQQLLNTTYTYINKVIQGQIADIALQQEHISKVNKHDIIWIYTNKTAIYTTLMPVAITSSMFNISLLNSTNLNKALMNLGIAFQIIDDLKDLLPGPKAQYTDIQERKYTILAFNAINSEKIRPRHQSYLIKIYSTRTRLTSMQKHKIAQLLIKYGYQATLNLYNQLIKQSQDLIKTEPQMHKFIYDNQLYVIKLYATKITAELNRINRSIR